MKLKKLLFTGPILLTSSFDFNDADTTGDGNPPIGDDDQDGDGTGGDGF